ncbi:efflux transporter outer membrane subunit [Sphingomonas solaris]|uniref:Efflux transporter outer membrane subunit n=1 Tax=Alterirhizorhabdus solaris TaxID=2529389 RepID=A0A558QT75_9SPHN|nr:efflux transporter outer membrane subunit [Sphingomonas solaris]TVV70328.1 efflux transporter outer membrane subunit [Sphingomonas solaris]
MRHAVACAALLGLIGGTLAGCIGPRPDAPPASAVVPPAGWRTAVARGAPVGTGWWRAFGDPALDALVTRALANNLDLAVAVTRVEEARAQARLAEAQLFPSVDGVAAGSEARALSPFGIPTRSTTGQPAINISYDTDLFGRLRNASAAARAALLATAASRDTVALAIAATTASSYINLRALDARLETAVATLGARAEALRIARRRSDTGYTSRLELRQAEGEYRATEQLVPQARLAVTRAENALAVLLGEAPGPIARGLPLERLTPPAVPDGLPADLLRRRPDLFSAEQQLVAADRSLDSARAAFLPSVRLTGSAGLVLSSALPDPVTIWSLGGSVLAPLFDAGRLRAQADAATARRDQAAFAYRRTALTAFREVDDGLAAVLRTGEQVESLRGQVTALREALRVATNRYRAGYSPYLDQLDAQRQLLGAELSLIQARTDRLNALVSLDQAMGGGWPGPTG